MLLALPNAYQSHGGCFWCLRLQGPQAQLARRPQRLLSLLRLGCARFFAFACFCFFQQATCPYACMSCALLQRILSLPQLGCVPAALHARGGLAAVDKCGPFTNMHWGVQRAAEANTAVRTLPLRDDAYVKPPMFYSLQHRPLHLSTDDGWSYQERQRRQRRAGRFADDGGRCGAGGAGRCASLRLLVKIGSLHTYHLSLLRVACASKCSCRQGCCTSLHMLYCLHILFRLPRFAARAAAGAPRSGGSGCRRSWRMGGRRTWIGTLWPSRQALFWLLLRCDWILVQQEDGGGLGRPGHQGGCHVLP